MSNQTMDTRSSRARVGALIVVAALLSPLAVMAQAPVAKPVPATQPTVADDPDARPPVTPADLRILKRARELLDSPSKWNRADDRKCPASARTYSLYCALEVATTDVGQHFEHRGAALQEMRFVIDEIAASRNYDHRLMDYNNDPTTTFADVQEVLRITESLIALRLKGDAARVAKPVAR